MENNNQNMCLDWDDGIEEDGKEFVLLPDGDYNFVVTNFERGRYPGSAKIPPCNKAIITVKVHTDKGDASIRLDFIMYRTLEWRLSSFFRCIGQKKHGEKLIMNWNKVVGAMGRGHVTQKTYRNQYGEEKTINDVDRFYDYNPEFFKDDIDEDDLPFDKELSHSNKSEYDFLN